MYIFSTCGVVACTSSSYYIAKTYNYDNMPINNKSNRSTVLNKYTKMKEKVASKVPTIISTSKTTLYGSHSMVVIGYKTYSISYIENNKSKTTTETYYAVDDNGDAEKLHIYLKEICQGLGK